MTTTAGAVRELTDCQWAAVGRLLGEPPHDPHARGRPARPGREVLEGILWVLRNNAHWRDLPKEFPSYQTCHRRYKHWEADGTLRRVLEALARDLRERGGVEPSACVLEGDLLLTGDGAGEEAITRAEAERAWRWRTALLFLSPATRRLLRRLNSPLGRFI